MIGTDREKESDKSVLQVRFDDIDDVYEYTKTLVLIVFMAY